MHNIGNNVEVWISNKGTQTFYKFFFYFLLFSPNQENCIEVDAKCLVFLQFSQQTLVFVSKVPKTLYQPLAMPHSRRGPYQALIFSSCPHHLLLVFWELILGYVTPLDWYQIS